MGHTGAALASVLLMHNAGNIDGRDIEFCRLQLLVDDLQLLESERPDVLAAVRRKLQDPPTEHNYFGTRHEVSTAVALLQRGMHSFRYDQQPEADFEVEVSETKVGIECSSVHLTGAKLVTRDLHYKIRSCINDKDTKPYASSAVALCIDATNVQALTLQRGSLLWGNEATPGSTRPPQAAALGRSSSAPRSTITRSTSFSAPTGNSTAQPPTRRSSSA